jgi:predicted transcriptional regulator
MKNSILISIHPIYADKIISGEKFFEYRRKIPASTVTTLALYCTLPIQKILAVVDVVDNLTNSLDRLWELTHIGGGYRNLFLIAILMA